jgi:penicillin amidase
MVLSSFRKKGEQARMTSRLKTTALWIVALLLVVALLSSLFPGCAARHLIVYWMRPDYPRFTAGETIELPGLDEAAHVTQKVDGLWKIQAANEHDAMLTEGYLMARDRMAQMDLLRHIARGDLAALIGNEPFGDRSALDVDRMNRFLGFRDRAEQLYESTSGEERAALDVFVAGINAWLARGKLSLEHRLLGVRDGRDIRAWTAVDSLAIYEMIMHSLSGNADREVRRLAIACASGLSALDRVWPQDIEFRQFALPEEDLTDDFYPPQPAVVVDLVPELAELCRQGAQDEFSPMGPVEAKRRGAEPIALALFVDLLRDGWSASNNWAVSGARTQSGLPLLSSDPHLPHMNPPLVWGVEVEYPGQRVAGFTLPGLHRVVFGHNAYVAWGATTNHVDRQDLVVHRGRSVQIDGKEVAGYELEGEVMPFEYRTDVFEVRGSDPVRVTVRFTRDGPLLNDLDPFVAGKIPLTALRVTPIGRGGDIDGAAAINRAESAQDWADGISHLDLGCSSWVFADVQGNIGYRSPCEVPVRDGWKGTFPVPGWMRRYEWQGFVPKEALPSSDNPRRGWLATANNQIVPSLRFFTTYNNDVVAPNRFVRIARRVREESKAGLSVDSSSAIQLDARYESWPNLRKRLAKDLCERVDADDEDLVEQARNRFCGWDGEMARDSVGATLFTLLSNAMIDLALADDLPGGKDGELWHYVDSLPQFEVNVHWLWLRPARAPVWDDQKTPLVETRGDILEGALHAAVREGRERFGDNLDGWTWGTVRPFVLRHAFAPKDGFLGRLLNHPPIPIQGGNETPFKQQFPRSRRDLEPVIGPIVRFTVDMADPWAATYTMAGGESGWPRSPFYGNLVEDWSNGEARLMSPPPSDGDVQVRLVPEE